MHAVHVTQGRHLLYYYSAIVATSAVDLSNNSDARESSDIAIGEIHTYSLCAEHAANTADNASL